MKFITGFEDAKERSKLSDLAGFACVGDSMTVQADAVDADINVIMDKYARTGQLPPIKRLPSYGDFDGITDYREAIHAVRDAEELFMQLPAKVRSRFENDPGQFLEFCDTPANRLELAELGLLTKEAADAIRKEAEEVKPQPTDGDRTRAPTAARTGGARKAAGAGEGAGGETT